MFDMSKRLEAIRQYKENVENEANRKELERIETISQLEQNVMKLHDRIAELIETANECIEYDIPLEPKDRLCRLNYAGGCFMTNAINHHVGFWYAKYPSLSKKIFEIGIRNGGYNGKYDLHISTDEIYYSYEDEDLNRKSIYDWETAIYDLNKFLNQFDEFEREFYAYVDKIVSKF